MRLLVTGATGFIGKAFLRHLEDFNCTYPKICESIHVFGQKENAPDHLNKMCSWQQVDLLKNSETELELKIKATQATHLLHLAWFAEHGKFWKSADNRNWVESSHKLLKAFAQAGGKRFVGIGTCAEYDWTSGRLIEDSSPLLPSSLYGSSKLEFSKLAQVYCETNNMGYAWARIFFPYGPGEGGSRFVPSLIQKLICFQDAPTSSGEQKRDFIHVADIASALLKILSSKHNGVFNIGSGQAVPEREVVQKIGDKLGRSHLLRIGAILQKEPKAPLVEADTKKTEELLGWKAQVKLDEGLQSCIDDWQNRMDLE